ncbi:HAD-like protein [Aaosphaeria arxii CBS 175.79]|uniref:HAD-like protein n=1 Tax=Aaosphaeria arxii CBS 175.79 TaxID=1450172 RepID=A0A6A5Y1U5_9PLEO|nr:HAD-like protein [Aaosphaeria arxii CBS 175.79]KAF2019545.1 HAD-like protein [Aaosphaeria arxii CBS 175.79]
MSKLTDFRLLSFDVYGTLIDWERGAVRAYQPTLEKNGQTDLDPKVIITTHREVEAPILAENPSMKYAQLLTKVHPELCKRLGFAEPTAEESKAFGDSVPNWPVFPDTVDALKRLSKHYKLVVLSNVDNASFAGALAGPLENFQFDAVLTAEDIGSYKPDLRNFEYMFAKAKELGVERDQVLQTAQSQHHDHHPARKIGLKSCWIYRSSSIMGSRQDPVWDWRFDTLGEMADAVEEELRQS